MATPAGHSKPRVEYGWDAPGIMLGFLLGGGAALVLGLAVAHLQPFPWAGLAGAIVALLAAPVFLLGAAMLQYGLAGKLRTRDAILAEVEWRGNEQVLDIGTGAGMLLVGAARKLDHGGRAVGIDLWAAKDLSNNAEATTRRNIAIEGVADRIEVLTADAIAMPFADGTFDVVLSLLCLHNIEPKPSQIDACHEIARVLKPGGRVVIGDYVPTHDYAAALWNAGLTVRSSQSAFRVAGALMWILVADKPA